MRERGLSVPYAWPPRGNSKKEEPAGPADVVSKESLPTAERPDAVPFYADDFLAGTAAMTNEQTGAYIKLLMLQQSKGPLSKEEMNAITTEKLVHKKFQITDEGTYINPRMEKEVKTRLAHQAAQSDRAKKRWNGNGISTTLNDRGAVVKESLTTAKTAGRLPSSPTTEPSGAVCRGSAAALPVLKDLKDKTKTQEHKDVLVSTPPLINKGVNVLSFGVSDKSVGVTDSAGAGTQKGGGRAAVEPEFDQTVGVVEEFDQTVDDAETVAGVEMAKKPVRHKHGKKGWVLLSDDAYAGLVTEYGEAIVRDYIQRVDNYCESNENAKKYKRYEQVIRNWITVDRKAAKQKHTGRPEYEFERKARESNKYAGLVNRHLNQNRESE